MQFAIVYILPMVIDGDNSRRCCVFFCTREVVDNNIVVPTYNKDRFLFFTKSSPILL